MSKKIESFRMKTPVVIIGIGQLGGVFARGFLRLGYPVVPITRGVEMREVEQELPEPTLALVAVGEDDLHPVLENMPPSWKQRVGLLQNELLPRDWEAHKISDPTVAVVWFEKKHRQPVKAPIPSPVYGPQAELIVRAFDTLEIPARRLASPEALQYELALKYAYILTMNLAGLAGGETIADLLDRHADTTRAIVGEVLNLVERLAERDLPREQMMRDLFGYLDLARAHKARGRSAPKRLRRALAHADRLGLEVPHLRSLEADLREPDNTTPGE